MLLTARGLDSAFHPFLRLRASFYVVGCGLLALSALLVWQRQQPAERLSGQPNAMGAAVTQVAAYVPVGLVLLAGLALLRTWPHTRRVRPRIGN